jgi:hypothetical protein
MSAVAESSTTIRVLVNSNLKFNGVFYPKGVAIDLAEEQLAQIPEGVVTPLRPVQVYVPPPVTAVERAPKAAPTSSPTPTVVRLLTDGPTFEEWVDAGHEKAAYPPDGYTAQPTPAWLAYEAERRLLATAPSAPTITPPPTRTWTPGFNPPVREMK